MSCKLFLAISAFIWIFASLEAASLHGILDKSNAVVQKLDYEGVEANDRIARQTYPDGYSGEDSDEDDEEDDDELQHQATIRRQQAYEQSVDNSQEGSDEDNENNFEEVDDYFGRRLKRNVSPSESNNEVEGNSKPSSEAAENQDKQPALETDSTSSITPSASSSSNTSVLILIRDAIKKVTELPNTQQVATSAQQYFQMFEHFLQQTIEQVIGDDDDEEDEVESTTIAAETEKETVTEISDQSENQLLNETSDKESSSAQELPQPEKKPQDILEEKA